MAVCSRQLDVEAAANSVSRGVSPRRDSQLHLNPSVAGGVALRPPVPGAPLINYEAGKCFIWRSRTNTAELARGAARRSPSAGRPTRQADYRPDSVCIAAATIGPTRQARSPLSNRQIGTSKQLPATANERRVAWAQYWRRPRLRVGAFLGINHRPSVRLERPLGQHSSAHMLGPHFT